MKHLLCAMGLLGAMLSGPAFAEEASFCKLECDSARAQCKASTSKASGDDAVKLLASEETNPMARNAQGAVPSTGAQALERRGQQHRRAEQIGICDDKYQRCTRACSGSANGSDGSFPVRRHGNTG